VFLLLVSYVSISFHSRTDLFLGIGLYFTWRNWVAGLVLGSMIRDLGLSHAFETNSANAEIKSWIP
jgi:hypothetical protein